jgi:hypothetical protein
MKRFNTKGMMLFPNPMKKEEICKQENLIVVKECYCQNGHNLISKQAVFNGFNGILLKVKRNKVSGMVALSPVYGNKSRVSLNLILKEGEVWELCCPDCNVSLPKFSSCECGGDQITMFLDEKADYAHCIMLCNRIDCYNATIKYNDELIYYSGADTFI